MEEWSGTWWHCFVASLADGVLVLAIYAVGWIVFRRWDWFARPGSGGYGLMLIAGMFIGVSVEWLGVHVAKSWAYTTNMPVIPVLNVGLVPLVQMLFLPLAIFRVVAIWTERGQAEGRSS
jgi:hypothetical protein